MGLCMALCVDLCMVQDLASAGDMAAGVQDLGVALEVLVVSVALASYKLELRIPGY